MKRRGTMMHDGCDVTCVNMHVLFCSPGATRVLLYETMARGYA